MEFLAGTGLRSDHEGICIGVECWTRTLFAADHDEMRERALDRNAQRRGHLNVLRRAPKPHDANVDASVYQTDQRILKEAGEPCCVGLPALRALQSGACSQDAAHDSGHGARD